MTTILYGSTTSPYVRRVRLLLEGSDYQFETINVYDKSQREEFSRISPIRRLPVLKQDEQLIYDSAVIANHLLRQQQQPALTVEQYNLISTVDAATDSLIIILQSRNSGLDVDAAKLFYDLQISRVEACFDWLEQQALAGAFSQWDYPSIALITLLDWAAFRQLMDLAQYPELSQVLSRFADKPGVQATFPVQ